MNPDHPIILIVGEASMLRKDYAGPLEQAGIQVSLLPPGSDILSSLISVQPHMILAEITQAEDDWRRLLRDVRQSKDLISVIFLASLDVQTEAVEALKEGADDLLFFPLGFQSLLFRVRKALETRQIQEELRDLKGEVRVRRSQDQIVGGSAKIRLLIKQIIKVAETDLNVLITGETGTGKELVARALHYNSSRAGHPFITVNCSAIPENLLKNQLFGHVKGSYTGADSTVKGLYEEANGGTLFLDEIGDLDLSLQAKLLRVIESGEIQKIGGLETHQVNVRTLAATHKNLDIEMNEGRFREDLYYRLNVFPIQVPPLKERLEDIPLLATHFLKRYQMDTGKTLDGFSPSAIQKLMFYDWPGNVRELGNKIQQAMLQAQGPQIYREDIPFDAEKGAPTLKSFKEAKEEFTKNYVTNVLRISGGNVAAAARMAKKDRKDFYDVMRKHKIRAQDFKRL